MRTLYSYYRSSAAYRVRIALALKHLDYQYQTVHLVNQGGEQKLPAYQAKNPQALVPFLEIDENNATLFGLSQSLAILEYLDETHPSPALLPNNVQERAVVRSLSLLIACEIHPLNNLRVVKHLSAEFNVSEEQKTQWMNHWMSQGLTRFQAQRRQQWQHYHPNQPLPKFVWGDTPGMADCFLIPQLYNAHRFGCDLSQLAELFAIEQACLQHPAVMAALPENQPDAP